MYEHYMFLGVALMAGLILVFNYTRGTVSPIREFFHSTIPSYNNTSNWFQDDLDLLDESSTGLAAPDGIPTCPWKFFRYHASPWEKTWMRNVEKWQPYPCNNYSHHEKQADKWIQYTLPSQTGKQGEAPEDVFSYYEYEKACNHEKTRIYIEPLALAMRHPFICRNTTELGKYIINKEYLLIDWNIQSQLRDNSPFRRAYYFDLGASTFKSGAGGPSQEWILGEYEKRGINFAGIFAWEGFPFPAKQIFEELPARYQGVYHWYNVYANATAGDVSNPLEIMRKTVIESDFVVLKLDIDNPGLETLFINQLFSDVGLRKLVDDLYFEHHVNFLPMAPIWGYVPPNETLGDSLRLFSGLRYLGIRAHSWV